MMTLSRQYDSVISNLNNKLFSHTFDNDYLF